MTVSRSIVMESDVEIAAIGGHHGPMTLRTMKPPARDGGLGLLTAQAQRHERLYRTAPARG